MVFSFRTESHCKVYRSYQDGGDKNWAPSPHQEFGATFAQLPGSPLFLNNLRSFHQKQGTPTNGKTSNKNFRPIHGGRNQKRRQGRTFAKLFDTRLASDAEKVQNAPAMSKIFQAPRIHYRSRGRRSPDNSGRYRNVRCGSPFQTSPTDRLRRNICITPGIWMRGIAGTVDNRCG